MAKRSSRPTKAVKASGPIDVPVWLKPNKPAAKLFKALAKKLGDADIATPLDADALAQYCTWRVRHAEQLAALAEEKLILTRTISSDAYVNPRLRVISEIENHLHRLGAELGLMPGSRGRMRLVSKATGDGLQRGTLERLLEAGAGLPTNLSPEKLAEIENWVPPGMEKKRDGPLAASKTEKADDAKS
jgi:P27 family predicted phage terminase small subunit